MSSKRGQAEEAVRARQLRRGVGPAGLVLADPDALGREGREHAPQLRRIEPALEGALDVAVAERLTRGSQLVGQPRAEALQRVTQQHEDAGLGCRPGDELGRPEVDEVAGRPLARDLALRHGEVALIAPRVISTEGRLPGTIEEVQLLGLAARVDDVGMSLDEAVPPRGTGLLGADADVVGWTRAASRRGWPVAPADPVVAGRASDTRRASPAPPGDAAPP